MANGCVKKMLIFFYVEGLMNEGGVLLSVYFVTEIIHNDANDSVLCIVTMGS